MKKYLIKPLLMIFATAIAILSMPKIASAQVDYNLLTEVAKSCQTDVFSPEYYKKMGISVSKANVNASIIAAAQVDPYYLNSCINARYYHLLVLSKLPWLDSSGDIAPGYPAATAVSLTTLYYSSGSIGVLECIITQDPYSRECQNAPTFRAIFNISSSNYKIRDITTGEATKIPYIYMCPSCTISIDEISSMEKMTDGFIRWFLTLDKPRRREVMSIMGDEEAQIVNRRSINEEAQRAVQEYKKILQKVEQQDQEQRRIDILGE